MVLLVEVVEVVKVLVIVIEAISIVHSFLSPWYNQRGQNRRGSCGPAAPVPRLPRVIKEGNLSAKELRRIWKDEFLPSIRREIKTKILELKSSIKALTETCNAIEKSQDFVSKKYDTAIAALQSVKSQTANLDKKYQGVQFQFFPIFPVFLRLFLFSPIFKLKPPIFPIFLAGETKICNKIENEIIVVCVLERDLS